MDNKLYHFQASPSWSQVVFLALLIFSASTNSVVYS